MNYCSTSVRFRFPRWSHQGEDRGARFTSGSADGILRPSCGEQGCSIFERQRLASEGPGSHIWPSVS